MNQIIEHYGKVIIALAGILAATLITVAIVSIVNTKTRDSVNNIEYDNDIKNAINKNLNTK